MSGEGGGNLSIPFFEVWRTPLKFFQGSIDVFVEKLF
jgi:hypothetical protein